MSGLEDIRGDAGLLNVGGEGFGQVHAGEGGEAAEEGDSGMEMDDDTVHGMHHATGGSEGQSKRARCPRKLWSVP